MITCQNHPGEDITYRVCGLCIEDAIKRVKDKGLELMNNQDEWSIADNGYPEPTVITVDENTDFSKIHEQAQPLNGNSPKVRRSLIGMKIFKTPKEFEDWQCEEPREIFEVTPKSIGFDLRDNKIFVTYNAGIIE